MNATDTSLRPDARSPNSGDAPNGATAQDIEYLIARCALEDRKAFAALYDATSAKLFAVCLRVLGRNQPAEDAMQDAFIKIWKNADRYRVTGHSPMTWLITIARNTAIDRLRKQRGHKDMADYHDIIAAPGPTPEQSAIAASDAKRFGQCLDTLPEDRRAAITGAYLDGAAMRIWQNGQKCL